MGGPCWDEVTVRGWGEVVDMLYDRAGSRVGAGGTQFENGAKINSCV